VSEKEYKRLQAEAGLAEFDAMLEQGPNYVWAAVVGGVIGALVGSFAIKRREPAERHALKYAAVGASINMLLSYGVVATGKKVSDYAHKHPQLGFPAPMTPVVTSGELAGAPRHLYRARHSFEPQDQQDQQQQQQPQHHHHHHR